MKLALKARVKIEFQIENHLERWFSVLRNSWWLVKPYYDFVEITKPELTNVLFIKISRNFVAKP